MTQITCFAVCVVTVGLTLSGCGRPDRETPGTAPAATPATAVPGHPLDIAFKTNPDPPKIGDNVFEVTVKHADGTPVTDATVSTEFVMPRGTPEQQMAEMRTEANLTHQENGVYVGNGQVIMAGNWNVTVSVKRGAEEIGLKRLSVSAK